jgi:peptide/nickel transport system permease protein
MVTLILRRLAALPVVLVAIAAVVFFLSQVIPADPVVMMAGSDAPKEVLDRLRAELGLDRPILEQYWLYLGRLARGDLGVSIGHQTPIVEDIRRYFPATLELILGALIVAIGGGTVLGLYTAVNRGRLSDTMARVAGVMGASIPIFWLALLFQILFFRHLHWLPAEGRLPIGVEPPTTITGMYTVDSLFAGQWRTLRLATVHLLLPSAALAVNSFGLFLRMTRVTTLWVLGEDYVRTARAKGLLESQVLLRHVLRNACIPLITEAGLQFGRLLSASFLVEVVFSWPGVSNYAVRSTTSVDLPAVMGVVLLYATLYLVVNFLVDVGYAAVDPRMAYG